MENIQKKRLVGAAVIVMSSTIISRITGFFREMLIPGKLGFGPIADAYNIAFLMPDLMYNLLVGGSVAAALIPVLAGYIEKKDDEEGWKAVGTFINVSFIAMLAVCTLGIIFAPQLIRVVAIYGNKTTVRFDLAVKLTRILFPSVAFLMLAGLTNGVLNSYHRFAAAAYGPTLYNIGSALSILFFGNKTEQGVEMVAYGVMCSSIVYFLFQLSFAFKNLKHYRMKIYFRHKGFLKLVSLAIPSLISSSIVQINLIISSKYATYFDAGSVTALNMANKTWQMPLGIFAQGIGTALLPTLSARLAVGDFKEYKYTLMKGLRTVLLFAVPSAVGFVVLREPVIRTLFQISREVNETAVHITGNVLMCFSIGLVAQSVVAIMIRAFYAGNDARTPLYIGASTIVMNMALSSIFIKYTSLNVAGMALAYSVASSINAIALLFVLDKKMKGMYLDKLVDFLCRVVPAAIAMGCVLYLVNRLPFNLSLKRMQVIHLLLEVGVGALVYMGITLLLKVEESVYMLNMVIGKLKSFNYKIFKKH